MSYNHYLYIAIRAAIDAGRSIMDIYTRPSADLKIEYKADHSPLTQADKAANQIITPVLEATSLPVLSEEGEGISYKERAKWKTFWLVDPLDGTKEFIKHNGEFTVNIALVHERKPVLGVIYAPVRKELYFATESQGAFKLTHADFESQPSLDEIKTKATRLPVLHSHQGIVVIASRSHQTEQTNAYIDSLRKQGKPVTLISTGSSLKICLVAEGTADIYPRFAPTMEWDTAAGHAIARAAGCEIYHVDEKTPLLYNKENLKNPWFIVKPVSAAR